MTIKYLCKISFCRKDFPLKLVRVYDMIKYKKNVEICRISADMKKITRSDVKLFRCLGEWLLIVNESEQGNIKSTGNFL